MNNYLVDAITGVVDYYGGSVKARPSIIISISAYLGKPIAETPQRLGLWIRSNASLLQSNGVLATIIYNGSASPIYKLERFRIGQSEPDCDNEWLHAITLDDLLRAYLKNCTPDSIIAEDKSFVDEFKQSEAHKKQYVKGISYARFCDASHALIKERFPGVNGDTHNDLAIKVEGLGYLAIDFYQWYLDFIYPSI